MGRMLVFLYGVVSYSIFMASCVYAMGFVGDLYVPKSIDTSELSGFGAALVIDSALLGLFAVQHSVMARQGFKRLLTNIVVQPAERSTYNLISSLLLILLFWQWRPMPDIVWSVEVPYARLVLLALYWLGWLIVVSSTFLINHFDFVGLRQVYMYLRGREYEEVGFKQPSVFRLVRHPIMLGFIIAFWATPRMTAGHLVFAAASTAYILVGLRFEERDLVRCYGEAYRNYQQTVSMIIPFTRVK